MTESTKRGIQNGLIFVEDALGGKPPYPFTDEKVQFTSSMVSVSCLHDIDGEAELTLGPAEDVAAGLSAIFDGLIETPSKVVVISTVPGDHLLKANVPDTTTRIRIWRNHPVWADKVIVGWG
jgi:hypothetical protein